MRDWLLSICALATLAACGGSGGDANVQINGLTVRQAAVNCEDGAGALGVTFEDATQFPSSEERIRREQQTMARLSPEFAENADNLYFPAESIPHAIFATVSGNAQFYGFPIEAALNSAWIVTGDVDEVAAGVLRARNLEASIDQLRVAPTSSSDLFSRPQGFMPAMFYGEESDSYIPYQPEYGNRASDGRYDFTQATEAYAFPSITAERTGFIHELTLWRLSPTLTLASCHSRNPAAE